MRPEAIRQLVETALKIASSPTVLHLPSVRLGVGTDDAAVGADHARPEIPDQHRVTPAVGCHQSGAVILVFFFRRRRSRGGDMRKILAAAAVAICFASSAIGDLQEPLGKKAFG